MGTNKRETFNTSLTPPRYVLENDHPLKLYAQTRRMLIEKAAKGPEVTL